VKREVFSSLAPKTAGLRIKTFWENLAKRISHKTTGDPALTPKINSSFYKRTKFFMVSSTASWQRIFHVVKVAILKRCSFFLKIYSKETAN
jgi:hypothetical protein